MVKTHSSLTGSISLRVIDFLPAFLASSSRSFRIDGRDQELERGTSTVDDKNIHSLEAFENVLVNFWDCSGNNPYTISAYIETAD